MAVGTTGAEQLGALIQLTAVALETTWDSMRKQIITINNPRIYGEGVRPVACRWDLRELIARVNSFFKC